MGKGKPTDKSRAPEGLACPPEIASSWPPYRRASRDRSGPRSRIALPCRPPHPVQPFTIHLAKRSAWDCRGVLPSGPGVDHHSTFCQNWFLTFSGEVLRSAACSADRKSKAPLLLV